MRAECRRPPVASEASVEEPLLHAIEGAFGQRIHSGFGDKAFPRISHAPDIHRREISEMPRMNEALIEKCLNFFHKKTDEEVNP